MNIRVYDMREQLLPKDHLQAVQEELAGFLLTKVIAEKGEHHINRT
jgi:hypothetical protein